MERRQAGNTSDPGDGGGEGSGEFPIPTALRPSPNHAAAEFSLSIVKQTLNRFHSRCLSEGI